MKKHFQGARSRTAAAVVVLSITSMVWFSSAVSVHAAVTDWQKGISFYPTSPDDFGSDNFKQTVNHFKSLGFNYVTLIIQLYQSNTGSTDIGAGGNTPTDQSLAAAVQYAHSQGMRVAFKIHLDSYDGQWRANINPWDRTTWYSNYTNELLHYASIAKQQGVEEYILGTELISVSSASVHADNTSQWQTIIGKVRSNYSGAVVYDANWGGGGFTDEVHNIQFWGSLDAIGISAYYNLNTDGSVASLKNAWNDINTNSIRGLNQQYGKPILFSEIGYRSVSGAHYEPWNSGRGGNYDPQEQINDYTALFEYWNDYPYLSGIQAWYGIANPGAGGSGNTDYLIQNKPVEQTIAKWFVGGSNSAPSPQSSGAATPSGPVTFTTSGSATPNAVSVGSTVSLSTQVQATGSSVSGANVDLEVYTSSGQQVLQKIFGSQDFSAGSSKTYTANFTPSSSGTYTLKIGVFNGSWSSNYTWNNNAATFSASAAAAPPSSGGAAAASSGVISNWWPTDGAHVSGVQPFKALLENTPLSSYSLFWQVDGGGLVQMADTMEGYPHKEALVDLSGWNWKGNGPYVITFVAKNGSGDVLASKSIQIFIP